MRATAPRPDLGPCPGESPFLGIHHVEFTTHDMNRTVNFYMNVLGIPVVATARGTMDEVECRRYWFDAGAGDTILFIERADARYRSREATATREPPGRFVAFTLRVRDEYDLLAVQERLVQSGVDVTPIEDRGLWRRVRFTDPNGLTVEAAYWKEGALPQYEAAYRDPDPVPALAERSLPQETETRR